MFFRRSDPKALEFPTEHPHGHLHAHLELEVALTAPLRWDLYTVALGAARAMHDSYDDHLRYLASAGYDWDDELRFDPRSGRLAGVVLKIGEVGALSDEVARSWLALPRTRGLPVAKGHRELVHLTPETSRWLSGDARALVVVAPQTPPAGEGALRLAVHADLDLLFVSGHYHGWLLHEPLERLAGASDLDESARDERHGSLVGVLHDYLALVIGPTMAAMERREHSVLVALEALRARLLELRAHDAVADGLAGRIEELIDTFYG